MVRTVAAVVAALLSLLIVGVPGTLGAPAPISATSWRATLVGPTLHGGATTLLPVSGPGSVNVKVTGVAAGASATASVVEARCGRDGATFASFPLRVDANGVATGKLQLPAAQVTAYVQARRAQVTFSIRVATAGTSACGDQTGAPSVGTVVLVGAKQGLYRYHLHVPDLRGLPASVAKTINDQTYAAARATADAFVADATAAADGESTALQTFTVTLALPTLLSFVEHYVPDVVGAPHGDEQFFTFTFDLATGHRILLTELFRQDRDWLAALSKAAIARLRPTLGSFAGAVAGPIATNFDAWRLVPGGLAITFAQAQGFAVPITTITIPWSTLLPVLDRQSPIARLLPPA